MTRTELFAQIQKKRSYLCVGLDTDLDKIPQHLLSHADPVFEFNKQIIDATAEFCIAYKPNIAFYEAQGPRGWESLQKTLALEEPIRCMECIDIAHLGGDETVGSKVSFIDGRPFKSEYRRYRVKSVTGGNDDYSSIREVVSRRYRDWRTATA